MAKKCRNFRQLNNLFIYKTLLILALLNSAKPIPIKKQGLFFVIFEDKYNFFTYLFDIKRRKKVIS